MVLVEVTVFDEQGSELERVDLDEFPAALDGRGPCR